MNRDAVLKVANDTRGLLLLVDDNGLQLGVCRFAAELEAACRCECGQPTCVSPWAPGCGLGTSEAHAVVAPPYVPAGWQLVPTEPTQEWRGRLAEMGYRYRTHETIRDVLTAAPKVP